jgi:hypothetical protein
VEKRLRGDFIVQKLHLLPLAKVVKGRAGQHQVNKQLGPANGELETHQVIGADLLDADKLATDFARESIGRAWRSGGGEVLGHGLAGWCFMTLQGPCQKWARHQKSRYFKGIPLKDRCFFFHSWTK